MPGRRNYHIQGAISPMAVRLFKQRERDDLSRWKDISDAELERRERKLPFAMPVWDELQRPQKICAVIGARLRKLMVFMDTGMGKTFLSLALMAYFKKAGVSKRSLVLVPNTVNKAEWGNQIRKHTPWIKYVILEDSTDHRWKQITDNPDADVYIDTYGGFIRMGCDMKPVKKKRGKAEDELVLNRTKVAKLAKFFDGLYADESTFLANDEVIAYRICRQIMKNAAVGFELAAKPFGRDPIMLYPQAKLMDGGYALGETQGLFRAAFYDGKPKFWGGTDWKLKKGAQEEISRFLDDISISFTPDEGDLPELVPDIVELNLPADADSYADQCREMLKASQGNQQLMQNAFLRMRQISSGFIGYKDDDTGSRAQFVFGANPKLDWTRDFVQKMKRTKPTKTIIFHEFHFTADVLKKMLTKEKVNFLMINGMEGEKANLKSLRQYQEDDAVEYLVLSNAAGGYGLNLQMTEHAIYYESPVPVILRYQTQKRFHRQFGRHKTTFMHDLVVLGTSDQAILGFHREGKNLWKNVMNYGTRKSA